MTDDQRQHLAAILDDMDAAKQHVAAARRALDAIGPAPDLPTFGLRLALQQTDTNINAATMSAMAAMERGQV